VTRFLEDVSSAFSLGVGYEPQPQAASFSTDAVRGYPLDLTAKTTVANAHNGSALPPADLAQLGLGWWERRLAGEEHATAQFERICAELEQQAERQDGRLVWPYTMSVPKYKTEAPWYSAMAQGQIASVFTRAYLATGRDAHAVTALEAVDPLIDRSVPGLVTETSDGPVLEEGSSEPPSHILNGWMYALWGLWDVCLGLGDAASGQLFGASAECLRKTLDRYDTGWWTRYSLYPHAVDDLAKPFYHRLHINQIAVMHRLTGASDFADAADRWAGYDRADRRARAVAHKAVFVLVTRRSFE
jgi:heparosan-N-sulfate-glucuronate 5-epimerase